MASELVISESPSLAPIQTASPAISEPCGATTPNSGDLGAAAPNPALVCPPPPKKPKRRRGSCLHKVFFHVPDDLTLVFLPAHRQKVSNSGGHSLSRRVCGSSKGWERAADDVDDEQVQQKEEDTFNYPAC